MDRAQYSEAIYVTPPQQPTRVVEDAFALTGGIAVALAIFVIVIFLIWLISMVSMINLSANFSKFLEEYRYNEANKAPVDIVSTVEKKHEDVDSTKLPSDGKRLHFFSADKHILIALLTVLLLAGAGLIFILIIS